MADSVTMSDVIIPDLDEIQNMKVADLRKKLKAFGLPATGNKTELMERLQEACTSSKGSQSIHNSELNLGSAQISELEGFDDNSAVKEDVLLNQECFSSIINSSLEDFSSILDCPERLDSFETSQLHFDESQISPDDNVAIEENDILDPDSFSPYINSSLEDDSKVLNNSENKLNLNSPNVAKPLKKRTISKASGEVSASEKKVVLNRTNYALSEFNITPVSDPKPETVETDNKSETDAKKVLSVKGMSSAERLAMRAKRFNISSTAVTANSKSLSIRNSKQSILSSAPVAPDLEVLKKRAERFGQCVSTVMKQIEQKEKLLKRKCKFGANLSVSAASSLDEMEKKRRRAERFGIS